jgi:hypothetical protein
LLYINKLKDYELRNFSASNAAIQPLPAEVIACLYFLSWTSPAANTQGILVCVVQGLVIIYQVSSVLICQFRKDVLGVCHIA